MTCTVLDTESFARSAVRDRSVKRHQESKVHKILFTLQSSVSKGTKVVWKGTLVPFHTDDRRVKNVLCIDITNDQFGFSEETVF